MCFLGFIVRVIFMGKLKNINKMDDHRKIATFYNSKQSLIKVIKFNNINILEKQE